MTCGICSMKLLSDVSVEIGILQISSNIKYEFLSSFNLGVNLFPAAGKHFTKITFDIKIEIGISEIYLTNFNKFREFLIF